MTRKTQGPAKRKRKPLSPAEQSQRFIEAAREAGVDTSDETLERIVRQIARPRQGTIHVTGVSEVSARKKLAAWKRKNPKAKIISEEVKSVTHLDGGKTAAVFIVVKYEQ